MPDNDSHNRLLTIIQDLKGTVSPKNGRKWMHFDVCVF